MDGRERGNSKSRWVARMGIEVKSEQDMDNAPIQTIYPCRAMRQLTISVAMCSYNGEKYLQEQLDSIANQSRPPDEVIVCDDKSTDQSVSILERFSNSVT